MADRTTAALRRALDAASLQQRVVANNIANLETPGYVARRVDFQDTLRAALQADRDGDETALEQVAPLVTRDPSPPASPGGNNVDIEREMTLLGEAGLRYEALTRLLRRKFEMLGTAIGDGRRA